jgi:hypothetical protein
MIHQEHEVHEGRKRRGVAFSADQYAPLRALLKEALIHLPKNKCPAAPGRAFLRQLKQPLPVNRERRGSSPLTY